MRMAKKKNKNKHRSWKFLGLGILIIISLIALYLTYMFLDILVISLAVSYMIYPLAKKLNKSRAMKSEHHMFSSMLAVLLVAIPVIFILFFGVNMVLRWFIENLPAITAGRFQTDFTLALEKAGLGIVSTRIAAEAGKLVAGFADSIGALVLRPTWLLEIFMKVAIFFISTFYFVYEGPKIKGLIKEHIPVREKFINELISSINNIFYGLFIGHFLTSIIIAIFAGIGFWIFLRPNIFMLGFLTVLLFIISFLPVIGPWLMYVPLGIWQAVFRGDVFGGIGLIIYSAITINVLCDFYIRPKLVRRGTEIHPLLFILGFFGGVLVMGPVGIIIGPVIMGLAQAIFTIYIKKRHMLKDLIKHF